MRVRIVVFAFSAALFGCGGIHYTVVATAASSRLEEARTLGAEQYAPYDYYFAKEHYEQSQLEASAASYSDAIDLAQQAEAHAAAAIEQTQKAKRVEP